MPRQVKCVDIGELRPKEECYKSPEGKYYSSKSVYQKMQTEKIYRKKCIDLYMEWVNRQDKSSPSLWTKKMKECQVYGYEVIYTAMTMADNNVRYAIANKNFNAEYQMASYLWAIVNSNMLDAKKLIGARKRRENEAKIQEQSYEYEDTNITSKHRSGAIDISRFLD